mgnify:CR=1 FL=1
MAPNPQGPEMPGRNNPNPQFPNRFSKGLLLWLAFFGLVAYATYDLTNQATMRDWPWHITAIDLVWGAVLTAASTLGARAMHRPLHCPLRWHRPPRA